MSENEQSGKRYDLEDRTFRFAKDVRAFVKAILRLRSLFRISDFGFRVLGVVFVLAVSTPYARAHEVRPAYLEIKETEPGQFSVLWRTPVLAGMRLPVALKLPDELRNVKEPVVQELADSLIERRWIEAGPQGLAGKRIEFPGLQLTITDALVRYEMLDGRNGTAIVRPAQPWLEMAAAQSWLGVAGTYVGQGVLHILFGVDHLLFVLGLLLIVKDRWMLIKTITAFTVAHSITLAIATLGLCQSSGRPAQRRHRPEHSVSRSGNCSMLAR